MSAERPPGPPASPPPVSAFGSPVAELIAQGMLAPPPRPGVLAALDQYEILRLVGAGGMGIVLLARDPAAGREVAIKMIKAELVNQANVVYRFLKEARHLQRLQHPHVVAVTAILERPAGPYFVMPYFAQGSLAGRIQPGQPLPAATVLELAIQVAEGLSFAHRNGIIHRDLKPANILLTAAGQACLADFGLARSVFNDSLTEVGSGGQEGTAPYMSPAVAAGEAEDTRCDIYSFGAVIYEMLTGWPPYQGQGARDILQQVIAGPPRPILSVAPKADRGLVAVAEGCLARELRNRYADLRDVLADLAALRARRAPAGPRGTGVEGRPRGAWLTWTLAGAAALGVVSLAAWQAGWLGRLAGAKLKAAPIVTNHLVIPGPGLAPVVVSQLPPAQPGLVAVPLPPVWNTELLAGLPGVEGYSDGPGEEARFHLPNSMGVDAEGNLLVADTGNHAIRKVTPAGLVTTLAGLPGTPGTNDGPAALARFAAPFGLAVASSGLIMVADTLNNTIRQITPEGQVTTLAGSPFAAGDTDAKGRLARFRNPWAVAVDLAGAVLVADRGNSTIRKITPDGTVTTVAGEAGQTGTTDGLGVEARFNAPCGVAVDRAGNIYVADTGNHTIRLISPAGLVSTPAGLPGYAGVADGLSDNARFNAPQGLALDAADNLYVADTGNNVLRKMTPLGEVTTLGKLENTEPTVHFESPAGVAVVSATNLLVADTGGQVVRRLVLGKAR